MLNDGVALVFDVISPLSSSEQHHISRDAPITTSP